IPVPAVESGGNCYVLCVGLDANTGKQWAYYTDTYDTGIWVRRFNIDNPAEDELVVERDKGRYGFRNFAGISADLNELVVAHQDGALYYDLASGNDPINLKSQPGGEPVGTCNITISPDDDKNAFWIGKYGYNTGGATGGAHSAIATNTDLLSVNTRTDHLIPNDPVFLEKMIAKPSMSTNTAICTQWAFDRTKCRVGTYVAWYDCKGRGTDPCTGHNPRATAVRFNDDLTEILDFEQFIPISKDNVSITEGRPHMWFYPSSTGVAQQPASAKTVIGIDVHVSSHTITVTFGNASDIEVELISPNGARVAKVKAYKRTRLSIDRAQFTAGMYFLSIRANGRRVAQRMITF
ncbi:MAG: T9SS type A sorting domain-containing protein, partial [Chitinivibrionales bacterium]|nr:T9SS type A sorting domain-containing protein [Chitinivibrionales bacterium]